MVLVSSVLRLDPAISLVWRDPFSLQFGVDPARVVLREVSNADERVIAALRSGVTRAGLAMVAKASGLRPKELDRLVDSLRPLFVAAGDASTASRAGRRVAVAGAGPTARLLAHALGEELPGGRPIGVVARDAECDFGVAIGHYVLDPREYGYWLRRDIPHLPIIFGDTTVTIGPLVEPGTTACLYCIEHHRRDADASWSAIASQLWGRTSAAESPLAAREVTAIAARMILRRLDDGPIPGVAAATSIRLEVTRGALTRREWMPHPECGCIDLAGDAPSRPSEALSRIGSAADSVRPRRSAGAPAPA